MSNVTYYLLCGICVIAVLWGINMMSKVKTSVRGNGLSAIAMAAAIALIWATRTGNTGVGIVLAMCAALAVGAAIGIYGAAEAKMIDMPQIIALLNGLGGGASALRVHLRPAASSHSAARRCCRVARIFSIDRAFAGDGIGDAARILRLRHRPALVFRSDDMRADGACAGMRYSDRAHVSCGGGVPAGFVLPESGMSHPL